MKIYLSLASNVLDGKDRFRKKASKDFRSKIAKLAEDMPNVFKVQAQQEQWLRDEVNKIRAIGVMAFKTDKLQLAPILKEFRDNIPIPEALMDVLDKYGLSWLTEVEERKLREIGKAYLAQPGKLEKVIQVLEKQQHLIAELTKEADTKTWYAPWRRYAPINFNAEEQLKFFKSYKA